MAIKKDKVYTKWVYDFKTDQSEKEEFFSFQAYEYEFIFEGEPDPDGSWFADINDPDIENDNPGLYHDGQVFDTKFACIQNEIDTLKQYMRFAQDHVEERDILDLKSFKREMELELLNDAH